MNQPCAYKYCISNASGNKNQLLFSCPICKLVNYCTSRCRDLDWTTSHKANCRVPHQRSKTDLNDTGSSLRSIRRSAEDFEIVVKDNKVELGKGSYGCVKLVRDRASQQFYAMKVMNKKQIFEYCSVENLKREIKIQRRLQHPHVTKLFHYFEDKENVFLILELAGICQVDVDNGSLFSYLRKRKRLPENEAFVYFFQTCLGIDYLHKKNIIHRDLKPENLLLDKQGNIKVCDFGWSAETTQNNKRTTFCGTLDYMAPEMLLNKPHDFTLDIWCLGILLYELIHGYAPFKGKTETEKCNNIVKMVPIEFEPTVSIEAKKLIMSILKFTPSERISMALIFEHPFMKKFYKGYGIDLKSYLYNKEDRNNSRDRSSSPDEDDLRFKKVETMSKSSNIGEKSTVSSNFYLQDDEFRTRVTRVSQRQGQREIQPPQRQEELGFMDKVFHAFGCLNREKAPTQY